MRKLQVVTNSELVTFDGCRALHGYRYHENLRPIDATTQQTRGTIYHAAIKGGWRAVWGSPPVVAQPLSARICLAVNAALDIVEQLTDEVLRAISPDDVDRFEEWQETREILRFAVRHYWQECGEDLEPLRFIPLAIEAPFEVVVENDRGNPTQLAYGGVIDLALYDVEQASVLIEDHKLVANPAGYEGRLELDTQMTGYVYALQCLRRLPAHPFWAFANSDAVQSVMLEPGHSARIIERASVGQVVFGVMKAKVPSTPSVNMKGDVSVKRIDTLPEAYNDALQEQLGRGIPISEKQDALLQSLLARPPWFRRFEFFRGADEILRWRRELEVKARQIRETGRHPELRTRNDGHCTSPGSYSCAYRAICIDPGSDAIRRNGYRVATESHEEIAAAKAEQHGSKKEQETREDDDQETAWSP